VVISADIQKWKLMGKLLLYAIQANMHFLIATSMNCVNIRNAPCYIVAMSELLCNACVILAKYTLNLPYIYPIFLSKINPIFLYNFGQKWLDTLLVVTHLPSMTMAKQEHMHYVYT
jgi:hypothetical protein